MALKLYIAMSRTLRYMEQKSAELFREYGLTAGQFAVLEALYHKGPLCVGEVQKLILTTTGNMPVVVRNLQKQGLILKEKSEKDRRSFILSLTEEGRALAAEVFPRNKAMLEGLMACWSEEEQANMHQLMKRFREVNYGEKN